jgi:DNA uptake protein ComE-like DNA-binding protein
VRHYAAMPRGRWVLASFIPVGWLTWVGLGYAGFRAKRPQWVWIGLGYGLLAAAAIVVTSLDDNEIGLEDDLGYLAMFGGWAAGIVHSLVIRKAYLRRIAILDDPALQSARRERERQAYARELARSDPELARQAQIGRRGGFDEGGVVDINHAAVEDIADLPGINAATARRIVAARDGVGGFSSLEDLGMTMDLPGDVVEELRGRVVFLPR